MADLQQQIALAKKTMAATKHFTGSGTIACRLWWALKRLVDAVDAAGPPEAEGDARR